MTSTLDNYVHHLIADYLHRNKHFETLKQLEIETNTPLTKKEEDREPLITESLESIVSDRFTFLSLQDKIQTIDKPFQNLSLDSLKPWTLSDTLTDSHSLYLRNPNSLVIHSAYWDFQFSNDNDDFTIKSTFGLFVDNTRTVHIHDLSSESLNSLVDISIPSQVKTVLGIPNSNYFITIGMDGLLKWFKLVTSKDCPTQFSSEIVLERQLHKRLVVDVNYFSLVDSQSGYLISIGWDKQLSVNQLDLINETITPIASYKLLSIPTCVYSFKWDSKPMILVGRLESSIVSFFKIDQTDKETPLLEVAKLSLNDSEFSSHAFHPTDIAQLGPETFTFATNHVPYMRLITVQLPSISDSSSSDLKSNQLDQEQSLHNSSIPIEREVIISNINSMSPQDKYSNSIILSRSNINSDMNGVWVFGDDGIIRGVDIHTGDVVKSLTTHTGRIKTGFGFKDEAHKEVIVTCGAIDRSIKVWK